MQVGAVFAINGKVLGLDCFGKTETFSTVFEKLVESYALDAIDWSDDNTEHKVGKGDVTKFLNDAIHSAVENRPSVGLGADLRLESEGLNGFALALDDQILHLSIFVQKDGENGERYSSSMQRFSNRRRFRA